MISFQYRARKVLLLTLPILAFAGEFASGDLVARALKPVAVDVSSLIIAGRGHYSVEEKLEE